MSSAPNTWTQYFGKVLTSGIATGTVSFPVAFLNVPINVETQVIYPSTGSDAIVVQIYGVTTAGFSYDVDPVPPNGSYILEGSATAVQSRASSCSGSSSTGSSSRTTSGRVALESGILTASGAFFPPFASTPNIVFSVIQANGDGSNVFVTGYDVTTSTFSVNLSGDPGEGAYLNYVAIL